MAKSMTCPTCKGSGETEEWYTDKKGISRKKTTTCTECGGTGEVFRSDQ